MASPPAAAAPYATWESSLATGWLPVFGAKWLYCDGLTHDAFVEGAEQAVKSHLVDSAPIDALPQIGAERAMPQLPGESSSSYKARLKNCWYLWSYAGTKQGVLTAIEELGYVNVAIYENTDWPWPPSPGYTVGQEWWRFWVVLSPPHPFTYSWAWAINNPVWGALSWGTNNAIALNAIKAQIRQWKPAHALCVHLIVVFSGASWGLGGRVWGTGTWGGVSAFYTV